MKHSALLFDANVWVALTLSGHPQHRQARESFFLATPECPAVFCRSTQQSYLRLISNPTILKLALASHLTNRDAFLAFQQFLSAPTIDILEEPAGTESLWLSLATRDTASPKVWMDAYLAAFAIAGNLRLVSFDRDFFTYIPHGLDLLFLNTP